MWQFCREVINGKIEKINEKAMRILYNEYESYKEITNKTGSYYWLWAFL